MKFWDFDKEPYRAVAPRSMIQKQPDGSLQRVELAPDVFVDSLDRVWYAGTKTLRSALPPDPVQEKTIPPMFWHPDKARQHSYQERQEYENERADLRSRRTWEKAEV